MPRIAPLAVISTSPSTRLARPKSVTWGWPSASTRMFAGFRSRCRMPRIWAWWTASAVSASRVAAALGLAWNAAIWSARLPPSTSFMLK